MGHAGIGKPTIDTVRISCGALCRIAHPTDDRLLLGLNRNALRRGQRVLKPIGGALTYDPAALPSDLTPTPEDPAKSELRLTLPADQVERFAAWFATRTGRETSPLRELREELVDEYGLMPVLIRDDLDITYTHTVRAQRFSDRVGATGVLTHSFQEIFTVRPTNPDVARLLTSAPPASGVYWVSAAQIRAGRYDDTTAIQARTLLPET